MKRVELIILGVLFPFFSIAQTIDDIGKVVVGVKILPSATEETLTNKEYIQSKLTNLVANAGFSSYGNNEFFISPTVIINDTQVAEGGMKNIYVLTGDFYLNVQGRDSETIFASMSFPFKGSGTTKAAALKSGLQKISYGNLKPFFDEAKSRILDYYSAMQDKIFAKADMLSQNREFDAAIACLLTIPEELFEPYQRAYSKACDIYRTRDTYIAEQIAAETRKLNDNVLVKARSLMASKDAVGTLKALWDYHIANTDQDQEYYKLLELAEARISAEEQAAIEQAKREYEERRFKEEREYQDMRRREEREYADKRREYEDNLYDRRQAYQDELQDRRQAYKDRIEDQRQVHADDVDFRNRQLALESKRADYERENQKELTEAVKTVALEYCKIYNSYE